MNTRNSNILNLILTNDIKIVSSIISTNPIEYDSHCSDHISILSCLIYPRSINRSISSSPILPIPNYIKSHYYNIKNDQLSSNWDTLLNASSNGYDMLIIFTYKLLFICKNIFLCLSLQNIDILLILTNYQINDDIFTILFVMKIVLLIGD